MQFATKWNRPESFSLDCDQNDIVERAGYIPVKAQVERLRLSGMQLAVHRAENYDGNDPEQLTIDPSRNMDDFEKADYFSAVHEHLKTAYEEAQERARMKTSVNQSADATAVPSDAKKEVNTNE